MRLLLPLLVPLFTLLAIPAQPPLAKTVVFVNATLLTAADAGRIPKGVLVVRGGKIVDVGAMDAVKIPAGADMVDLNGATVIPGLVDTHSHIGLFSKPSGGSDGNEGSGPVQPGVRAIDSINPDDPGIRMAIAGGVTTANIMPGSGNVIGGQTLYVKLRGRTVDEMRITGQRSDGSEVLGGLKMANGENPKGYGRTKQQAPFTRMKVAALQREQFIKAKEYQAKGGPRDVNLEPLVEVLQKKRTVHFHCHRADDLMTAVRIAEEFGFELVLQHATEGYRVAEELAKRKIPVSLTLLDSAGGKAETMGLLEENAAALEKAGVLVTINTDDSITESRFFLRTGAIAVRGGMSEESALKALTLTPAKILHLAHRVGSLEKGKDADFVVLSGSPFSVYTKVRQTWIDGQKVFDVSNEADRGYRDGGLLLPRGMTLPQVKPVPALPPGDAVLRKLPARDSAVAITWIFAGRLHTGTGEVLRKKLIVLEKGRIKSIERQTDVVPPKGVVAVAVTDVSPGLIDPFTVAGLSGAWNIPADQDQDEPSDSNQADLRVLDGFNPQEPLLDHLRANGVTVVHTTPGRVNPIAGRTGVFRLSGRTAEAAALKPTFAVLVNLGESAKGGKNPTTRMGTAALVRKAFADAQLPTATGKALSLKVAVDGKAPIIFAAHRADDIRTALRIAEEFKLNPILALGTEAWMLRDDLARRGVPVIVHPTMQRAAGSVETQHTLLASAALLHDAKVPVTIGSAFEGYVPKIRNLRYEAAMAAVNGLGHEAAMKAITLDAAKLLGIDKDYGSLEVGKVADLVLYDGDPFEHSTHVTHTLMNGTVVYDREEYLKLPLARRILPMLSGGPGTGCCLE